MVRIGTAFGDFLPVKIPFLWVLLVTPAKQSVAVVLIATGPNARPELLSTLVQLTRRNAA